MAPRIPKQDGEEIDNILLQDPQTCLPSLAARFNTSYKSVCERRRKLRVRLRTGTDERKKPGRKPGPNSKPRRKSTMPHREPDDATQAIRPELPTPPPSNVMEGFDPTLPPPGSKSINDVLDTARSSLARLSPQSAYHILTQPQPPPTTLVDIRPFHQRQAEGSIPGALIIERNVLEWRFDPRCEARLDIANRYDLRVIVFCSEGYTSSLAARSLQELGLWNATDIVGGYKAWRDAGLGGVPVREAERALPAG